MGWLFAVALGLHRRERKTVVLALVPIALGHAAAVGAVLLAVAAFGALIDPLTLGRGAGIILLMWAAGHAMAGHRHRIRIGMQSSLIGLALWSCIMAGAHGAGLMLLPSVLSLCIASAPGGELAASTSVLVSMSALAVHTGAMLAVIAVVSLVVYNQGVAFLRRGWINLDALWSSALVAGGLILLVE
jgi:hypothetical protein